MSLANKKNKILLCGCFAFDTNDHGGQPVKSRETFWALENMYGSENIDYVETENWKRNPLRLLLQFLKGCFSHDCIIMLPANNGVKVFSRLLLMSKKLHRNKIYYDVIGGWLPNILQSAKNKRLLQVLKQFDGIWVETEVMKEKLNILGMKNILVLPNFKHLNILKTEDLVFNSDLPLRVCTFSRVIPEKGIEDAVEAVREVNESLGRVSFLLDIYGECPESQKEWFDDLSSKFPDYVEYKGVIDPSHSVDVLKNYYALLFPTKFYTEGIPGTIIDAYTAGIPVISSRWQSFSDVIDDGVVGLGFQFGNQREFVDLLFKAQQQPLLLLNMKENCIKKAMCFNSKAGQEYLANALNTE